jgi:hypothetical protein
MHLDRGTLGPTLALAAIACGSAPQPSAPPAPAAATPAITAARPVFETIAPERCAAAVQDRFAIDTSAEPRACVALYEALVSLEPLLGTAARGLALVRDQRGRCGDTCPDLASALMSDATLAYYRGGDHTLHVNDATFDGPRWRGGTPSPTELAAYLRALGVDWPGLVARVRALPGADLPAGDLPLGDPRVLDAIVRRGPPVLLGGDVTLADLFRHELAHAIQLHDDTGPLHIGGWCSFTDWHEAGAGEPADGYVAGALGFEHPIVASRLMLGLPRGESIYRHAAAGPATPYAHFDPFEDFAESVRLAHADPGALAGASPVRFLLTATPAVLRDPALRVVILPGTRELVAAPDGAYAMAAIRRLGAALLPEAAAVADARPLPIPADATAAERDVIARAGLVVTIDGHTFRPTDAAFRYLFSRIRAGLEELEEFNRSLPAPE